MNKKIIENDLMRYKKNKLAGNLALLGLAFNCLYFMFVYAQVCGNRQQLFSNGQPVYTVLTGISVILNLIMLLSTFLTSEELKGYNKKFSYVAWVLGAIQLIRIFGYPLMTFTNTFGMKKSKIFGGGTFALFIVLLVASAACLVAAGVIGFIRTTRLERFKSELESGKVDLDAALKEEDTVPVAGGEVE